MANFMHKLNVMEKKATVDYLKLEQNTQKETTQ